MLPPHIAGLIKLWTVLGPFLKETFMGQGQLGQWFKQNKTYAVLFGCVLTLSAVSIFLIDQLNATYTAKQREQTELLMLQDRLLHTEDKVIVLTNVIRALNSQPMLDMPEHIPSVFPNTSISSPAREPPPDADDKPITIRSRLDELASEDFS